MFLGEVNAVLGEAYAVLEEVDVLFGEAVLFL